MKPRLLMFDDEPRILKFVGQYVVENGFEFKGSDVPLLSVVENFKPNIVLLDIMMPQKNGLAFLGELRHHPDYEKLPIILVSGRSAEIDQQAGLNQGADDYMVKPFVQATLLARIKALLRRSEQLLFLFNDGNLRVPKADPCIEVNGKTVRLTPMQRAVLSFLISARRPVQRTELRRLSQAQQSFTSRAIDMTVSQLRALIDSESMPITYIQTVRGLGYFFSPTRKS